MKPQVEKWYRHLQANPPTPQDWKDGGFDFSDKDNLTGLRLQAHLSPFPRSLKKQKTTRHDPQNQNLKYHRLLLWRSASPILYYVGLVLFSNECLFGALLFVLGFFHSILLLFSPLMFLMFTWFLGDDKRLEPLLSFGHNFVQFIIFFAHFMTLFYIWFYVGNEYWNGQKGNLFYIAPCLFFLSWCLNTGRNALHGLQWILQKAWWINITLEGKYAPSTGSSRDIHVDRKSIDRTCSSGENPANGGNTDFVILNPSPSYAY